MLKVATRLISVVTVFSLFYMILQPLLNLPLTFQLGCSVIGVVSLLFLFVAAATSWNNRGE
jgi:hypothetical protein